MRNLLFIFADMLCMSLSLSLFFFNNNEVAQANFLIVLSLIPKVTVIEIIATLYYFFTSIRGYYKRLVHLLFAGLQYGYLNLTAFVLMQEEHIVSVDFFLIFLLITSTLFYAYARFTNFVNKTV